MKKIPTSPPISGLGDVIDRATTVTGIKAATEWVANKTGKDCGCNKRKEALNKAFPFGKDKQDELRTDQD